MSDQPGAYHSGELTPETIRKHRFRTSTDGYAPDDVHEFMEQVASAMGVLMSKPGADAIRMELDRLNDTTSRLVMAAQEAGERLREAAATEAQEILEDAKALATDIRKRSMDESARTSRHIEEIRGAFVGELRDVYDRVGATLYRLEQQDGGDTAARIERSLAGMTGDHGGDAETATAPSAGEPAATPEPEPAAPDASDAADDGADPAPDNPTAFHSGPAATETPDEPAEAVDIADAAAFDLTPHDEDDDEPLVDLRPMHADAAATQDEPAAAEPDAAAAGEGAAAAAEPPDGVGTTPAMERPAEPTEPLQTPPEAAAVAADPEPDPGETPGLNFPSADTEQPPPPPAPGVPDDADLAVEASSVWGDTPAAAEPAAESATPGEVTPAAAAGEAAPAAAGAGAANPDDDQRAEALLGDMDRILGSPEGDAAPPPELLAGLTTDWPAAHQFILQQLADGGNPEQIELYMRTEMGAIHADQLIGHVMANAQAFVENQESQVIPPFGIADAQQPATPDDPSAGS